MTTQVAKRPAGAAGRAKKKSYIVDVPVTFGACGGGGGVARLSCALDVAHMNPDAAFDAFAGTRIKGRIVIGGADSAAGQTRFVDTDEALDGTFDCKAYTTNRKTIRFSLSSNIAVFPTQAWFNGFAKRSGRLLIESVDEIEGASEEDEAEDGEE